MIIGVIIGGIILIVVAVVVTYRLLAQKLFLELTNLNETKRKDSKAELESGVGDMLESNRKILSQIIDNLQSQLKDGRREIGDLKTQNAAIREQLTNTAKITEGLQASAEGLKNILSNNRLRGNWGEQVAEDLLLAAGFVENFNYVKQASTGESRPDFTILLPDGAKLNVDAKFPFDDLMAYQEAKTDTVRRQALASFSSAVKTKVKDITSKDYIDPQNQTLDFVVMFIPNEMIFSFIYEKLPDINAYCNERKVVLAGPFGFTAVLRLVLQAYRNFGYEKNLQQIFGLVSKFQEEYAKFGESLERLGKQLETTQKTYHEIEGTRSRQLTKVVDKISGHAALESPSTEPLLLQKPTSEE